VGTLTLPGGRAERSMLPERFDFISLQLMRKGPHNAVIVIFTGGLLAANTPPHYTPVIGISDFCWPLLAPRSVAAHQTFYGFRSLEMRFLIGPVILAYGLAVPIVVFCAAPKAGEVVAFRR
jgi:hypothetical protein